LIFEGAMKRIHIRYPDVMCDLYSMTKSQQAIWALARAMRATVRAGAAEAAEAAEPMPHGAVMPRL